MEKHKLDYSYWPRLPYHISNQEIVSEQVLQLDKERVVYGTIFFHTVQHEAQIKGFK